LTGEGTAPPQACEETSIDTGLTVEDVLRRIEAEDPSPSCSTVAALGPAENLRRALQHRHAPELSQLCSYDAAGIIRFASDGAGRRWLRYARADDRACAIATCAEWG
jgi:hypothetical protein